MPILCLIISAFQKELTFLFCFVPLLEPAIIYNMFVICKDSEVANTQSDALVNK